jgi:hypothetical protein
MIALITINRLDKLIERSAKHTECLMGHEKITPITDDLGGMPEKSSRSKHTLFIGAHPTGNDWIKERVQLESDEAEQLLVTL